jgi:hypothetical protein
MQLESAIEDACRLIAAEHGWLSRKMNGLGHRSWPDRLFIQPPTLIGGGDDFWVEFKRPDVDVTPDQKRMISNLKARGQKVYICHSTDEFRKILKRHHG